MALCFRQFMHNNRQFCCSRGAFTAVYSVHCPLYNARHVQLRSTPLVHAKRREIEPVAFTDLYESLYDRIVGSNGFLTKTDTLVLVESANSKEQAMKVLELIQRHLENRGETTINDWHMRKKYYMRLSEMALQKSYPDLILHLFGNADKYQLSTYFCKEVVSRLAELDANPDLLMKIVDLFKVQRPAGDKGVRSAWLTLLDILKTRNADKPLLARVQQNLQTKPIVVGTTPAAAVPTKESMVVSA